MASEPADRKHLAVVLGSDNADRPRSLATDLEDLGHRVTFVLVDHGEDAAAMTPTFAGPVITVPRLPVRVSPGFLEVSYRLYRALEGSSFDAVVFPDRGGHGYCCARARQLGLGFSTTTIVVHCTGPTLRVVTDEGRAFIPKSQVGTMAVERVTIRIADAAVCDDAALAWMHGHGWKLPARTYTPDSEGWAKVLSQPPDVRSRPAQASAPPVSVVVTHYERPRLLSTCLEALSAQTHQPIEVIVADDGSSSAEAVGELATSEARSWPWSFRVLRLSHGGVHGARNAGWRAATGELVLFVDDDDVPFPELVETLLAARAESGADVVSASSRTFNGEGPPVARTQDVISLKLGEPYEMGVLSNHYGGPTCLWPRDVLERLHGFADSFALAEDWEILARAAAMGVEIAGTPNPLFWNRQLQGGRVNRSLYALRDRSLTTVASHFSTELPETLSMLPLLAAGAYEELERRKARSLTRRFRVTRRSQELIRHARSVAVDEGWRSVLERAVSSLVRRWG